jgi:hypothetical protein
MVSGRMKIDIFFPGLDLSEKEKRSGITWAV